MANEILNQQPPAQEPAQNDPPIETGQPENIAAGLDNELDGALAKMFGNKSNAPEIKSEPKVEEKPNEKAQTQKSEVKEEVKPTSPSDRPKETKDLPPAESFGDDIPKKQQGWTALKNSYKQAGRIIGERDEEIKKLKELVAEKGSMSGKEIEDLRTQNKELSKYRAMIDIQSDPEFIKNFDQPMNDKVNEIVELLKPHGVTEEVARSIDFNNSKLISIITKQIIDSKDDVVAEDFRSLAREARTLINKRNKAAEDQGKNYNEILETRKKESSLKGAEEEGRILKRLTAITTTKDKEGNPAFPFMTKMEPRDGMAPAEQENLNTHNSMVDLMQKRVNEAVKMNSPEEKAELAVAAVASHYLAAQLRSASSKIKSLEEELKKISTVSSDTEKSKPRGTGGRFTSDKDMDVDSALAKHFAR